jgi:hypothetical protein
MCLISVLPKGTKKDTEEVYKFIRNGAQYNTDGSGFMYKINGQSVINVDKGYFNVESMIDKIKSLKLTEDDELVVHHRIGTVGLVTSENTHPFVLSEFHEEVAALAITIDKPAMVHNGGFGYIGTYIDKNPEFSDTYAFARYFLGNKNILGLYNDNPDLFDYTFKGCIGTDKICILHPEKDLTMKGNFIEDEGYFHSNTGYKRYTFDRGGSSTWGEGYGASTRSSTKGSEKSKESFPKKEQKESSLSELSTDKALNLEYLQDRRNVILLTSKHIKLTDSNFDHFAYIRKSAYDTTAVSQRKFLIIKSMIEFDEDDTYQYICYKVPGTDAIIDEPVPTKELINDFYYVPKSNYWATIYKDLKDLIDFNVTPTMENIRSLETTLGSSYNLTKTALDQIYYAKHCEMFCKQSLELLAEHYREVYYRNLEDSFKEKPVWTKKILSLLE